MNSGTQKRLWLCVNIPRGKLKEFSGFVDIGRFFGTKSISFMFDPCCLVHSRETFSQSFHRIVPLSDQYLVLALKKKVSCTATDWSGSFFPLCSTKKGFLVYLHSFLSLANVQHCDRISITLSNEIRVWIMSSLSVVVSCILPIEANIDNSRRGATTCQGPYSSLNTYWQANDSYVHLFYRTHVNLTKKVLYHKNTDCL